MNELSKIDQNILELEEGKLVHQGRRHAFESGGAHIFPKKNCPLWLRDKESFEI